MLRNYLSAKYHFCGRCGNRAPLEEMIYQLGVLVCKRGDCQDTTLKAERQAEITRILERLGDSKELQPDPKLTEASAMISDDVVFTP